MATTSTATAGIGDAVLTADGVMHAVTALHGERLELACGLLAKGLPLAESPDGPLCLDCGNGTTAPPAPEAPALEPTVEPSQDNEALALEGKGPLAEAISDAAHKANDAKLAEAEQRAANVAAAIANQPSKAAVEAKQVGHYSLEQLKKEGPWRVRDTRTGKLEAEGFELLTDAGWFAQRRTRLGQYQGFGGHRPLFMPKVPSTVGAYTIVGELGSVELQLDGQRVGPIWRHKTNGKVDAMRWAQRLERPTRATA